MTRSISTEAVITSIRLSQQGSDPSAPASTYWSLYVKSDGLYLRDSGGTVYGPFSTHAAVTISDTGTVDLSLTGQALSASVIPSGIKLDDLGTADDNTDLDATTGHHGLLPKLGGGSTNFLRADGTWAAPGGVGSGVTVLEAQVFS